jgi:chromosome segregation ATPase
MATVEMEVGVQSGVNWKSPLRKLVEFFRRSRDGWKAKYLAKKEQYKLMSNQLRAVEKSRAKWRQTAEEAQQEIRQLQQGLEQYKKSAA